MRVVSFLALHYDESDSEQAPCLLVWRDTSGQAGWGVGWGRAASGGDSVESGHKRQAGLLTEFGKIHIADKRDIFVAIKMM